MSKHHRTFVAITLLCALFAVSLFSYTHFRPTATTKPVDIVASPLIYEKKTYVSWGVNPVEFFAEEHLSGLSLEDKVRSLLFLNYPGTDIGTLQNYLAMYRPGGFILMGSNIPPSQEELSSLTAALRGTPEFPLLIGIDEEGGDVTRLPYDNYQGANTLRNEPAAATLEAFGLRGALLESVGVNVNFGVVADVSSDPYSFIYSRSFGSDATAVSERVEAAVAGEKPYVLSTIKHYPGHGSAPGDSHFTIPSSSLDYATWAASDALQFQTGIDSGTSFVMFGHLSVPAVDQAPASLSTTWHNILREKQGFQGISITDDMMMLENTGIAEFSNPGENAVRALAAGNDMLLYVPSITFDPNTLVNAILEAINNGRLTEDEINDSALKVAKIRRLLYPEATSWIPPCDLRCYVWGDS